MRAETFKKTWAELALIKSAINSNKYVGKNVIPIGTKRPLNEYGGKLSDEDIVWMEFRPDLQFNACVFAWAGVGKTRFLKRLVYYFYHNDYDVIVYDPKHVDWVKARKKGDAGRLAPQEVDDKLPVFYCTPSFTVQDLTFDIRELFNDSHVYTHKLQNIKTLLEWATLGIKDYNIVNTVKNVAKATTDMRKIAQKLNKMSKTDYEGSDAIFAQTAKSVNNKLFAMEDFGLFSSNYKELDIEKLWDEKKVIACSYFSKDEKFIQLDVGKNIQKIKDIREKYRMFRPLLQVFDDCHFYANRFLKQNESISMKNIVNSLIGWRSLGFNSIFCIQNPNKMNPDIIEESKHLFIGKMGSYEGLREYLTKEAFIALEYLYNDERTYIHQWMWVKPDNSYELFFPLGCIVGH